MNVKTIITIIGCVLVITVIVQSCQHAPETSGISVGEDIKKVKAILRTIDDYELNINSKMSVYDDSVVHMAQGSRAITNKAALRKILEADSTHGRSVMKHELVTLNSYQDMVLTRGRVKGTWYPADGGKSFPFETNNIITFRRKDDGTLKVWQVIFNRVVLENYKAN